MKQKHSGLKSKNKDLYNMKKIFVFVLYCLTFFTGFSQDIKIYPSNWWVGMKDPKLQLMIHGNENITMDKLVFRSSSPDVKVIKVNRPENRHYLFVDLQIAGTAKPQDVKFSFGGVIANEWKNFNYELKARSKEDGKTRAHGITSKDFLYLMIPDRFSNGDPTNDVIDSYHDQTSDRKNMFSRHGGDFKGVENHFDYFKQLGVTALWMTPILENNTAMLQEGGN